MKALNIIALTVFLTGCAQMEKKPQNILYKEFQEYKLLIETDYEMAITTKISKSYLAKMNEIDKNIPPELHTPFWTNLARKISIDHSHFEVINGKLGCLTINGLNSFDEPRSLSLYYVKENDNWVFNYIGVSAHESIQDYYTEPYCPDPKGQTI